MTHKEYHERKKIAVPCTANCITFGGRCLNCGWSPALAQLDSELLDEAERVLNQLKADGH